MADYREVTKIAKDKFDGALRTLGDNIDTESMARSNATSASNQLDKSKKNSGELLAEYLDTLGWDHHSREVIKGACANYLRKAGYTVHQGRCE